MKCKYCESEMDRSGLNDTCSNYRIGYAYNSYECPCCFSIARESVWSNKGVAWLEPLILEHETIEDLKKYQGS